MKGKGFRRAVAIVTTVVLFVLTVSAGYGKVPTSGTRHLGVGTTDSYRSYYQASPGVPENYVAPQVPQSSTPPEEEQEQAIDTPAPANIEVRVPMNAEIWFERDKTHQTGAARSFVSPRLEAGKAFTYTIRAHWTSPNGQVVDQTRQVQVRAGRRTVVDFLSP